MSFLLSGTSAYEITQNYIFWIYLSYFNLSPTVWFEYFILFPSKITSQLELISCQYHLEKFLHWKTLIFPLFGNQSKLPTFSREPIKLDCMFTEVNYPTPTDLPTTPLHCVHGLFWFFFSLFFLFWLSLWQGQQTGLNSERFWFESVGRRMYPLFRLVFQYLFPRHIAVRVCKSGLCSVDYSPLHFSFPLGDSVRLMLLLHTFIYEYSSV